MSYSIFYRKWDALKKRCNNKKYSGYKNYGGRGIKYEWRSFENFRYDMYGSYLEHTKKFGSKNTTLDRLDVNKNYSVQNCRWATCKEQSNNRRNTLFILYQNKMYPVSELSRKLGLHRSKIHNLLRTRTIDTIVKMIQNDEIN